MKFQLPIKGKTVENIALKLSDVFIILAIIDILTFMSMINFIHAQLS